MDLKDILNKKLNSLGIKRQVNASQVCAAYDKIVAEIFGEEISKETEAVSFKNGVLKVRVSSSSLAQEIQGKSREILVSIEKKTGLDKKIERIIFRT